ncbi:toprim domain-containing protein [Patescibacteria group bacterium]|nr:toprim domain-containing protein [Patescibacteria group bacterium]
MDVIALHQYGLPVGVATCGTALTPQHTKLIKRHSDKVIFAFDNDSAGFDAVVRGLKVAYQQDLFPKVFQFPTEFKDVDEYLTASPHPVTKTTLTEHSIDGFTFVLRKLDGQYDIENPVERKKVLTICFEMLAQVEDYTILVLYLDQMAKLFKTNTDALLTQLKSFLKTQRTVMHTTQEETSSQKGIDNKYILASLYFRDFLTTA